MLASVAALHDDVPRLRCQRTGAPVAAVMSGLLYDAPAHRRRRSTERARSASARPGVRVKRCRRRWQGLRGQPGGDRSRNGERARPARAVPSGAHQDLLQGVGHRAPAPQHLPCARTLVTTMSLRREGAASPRRLPLNQREPRRLGRLPRGRRGNSGCAGARVMEVTALDSRGAGSRPDSRTSWRYPGRGCLRGTRAGVQY